MNGFSDQKTMATRGLIAILIVFAIASAITTVAAKQQRLFKETQIQKTSSQISQSLVDAIAKNLIAKQSTI